MAGRRSLNGSLAGAAAASVWALQQPRDKRLFGTRYDDVELLGKLVTRGRAWPLVGLAMHASNGAARRELEPLQGNRRALAAATWRHALFGILLGAVEQRLNRSAEIADL